MGAYSFKKQFEPKIMADEKRHTIRDLRNGRVPKVGEVLSLYVGMRTKECRLLKRRRCTKVQTVKIVGRLHSFGDFIGGVLIDGTQLIGDELACLAISDGFSSFDEMMRFWDGRLPFTGLMVHWESDAAHAKDPAPDHRPHRPATGSGRQRAEAIREMPA